MLAYARTMLSRTGWWLAGALAVAGCDRVFGVPPPGDAVERDTDDGRDGSVTDPAIVAHYRFEMISPAVTDETGRHDGEAIGGVTAVPGRVGAAILFAAEMPLPHVLVPNQAAWDLPEGAIELWVRPVASAGQIGILSRDNSGTSDGHFVLVQLADKFFVVRLQTSTDGGAGGGVFLCSNQAPTPGAWMHVGINLGAPTAELWVDGVLGTRTDSFSIFGGQGTCNTASARSILGNDDPWVFGALSVQSQPGTTSLLSNPFVDGAIDELIIWRTRRDFAVQ